MVVLGFQDAAKWVFAAGSGGTGIANDVLLGMCDGCPTSGHHARTQRRRQRVHHAYGTHTGYCTGAYPEIPRKTTTNGLDNAGAQRRGQRKHGAGDDARAVRSSSRIDGRGGTPWGEQRGLKNILYGPFMPRFLRDPIGSLSKNRPPNIELNEPIYPSVIQWDNPAEAGRN